ncbi:DUF5689 domain-containing protein [Alistipes putredinis]|uniref:DUF5689 domain-containing protein n=1 Tax=Alistipes putredinis TaxID=28117 RepID=UPI002AC36B1C|nr:DUF5689 domain-containing protein [Alistipes putredinis]
MKKSSIWKLLFSALTVFAVVVFAGCTDDNDDMGAPYLNVTPENLTFDAEGQPADEYNGTFIVETNRPWRAIVEDEQTWVRLSATEGEGDAAVTVTVPASNIGQSAKVTFEVYNSYGALIQKDVNVLQGEVVPPTIIFNETAGNEAVDDKPLVSAYTGWNTTGEGASKVSYEGTNTSIRSSGKSSAGAYDGASGPNVIFFGTAPATFTVKNITLASGQTNLKLTFGGQYYDQDNNDNGFKKDDFVVSLSANGTDYTPLSYEVNNGDQEDPYWVFATKNFTLKNATSTLYIKFEANISSKFRLDDITLMTGNGGEEIDLAGGGVVPPDPSGDAIYENNFDKTPAEKVDNKWPFLDQTDAWQNASGTGNSTVTYTSTNVSVRTSGKLSGGYDGASGSNKIFFGSAPATFDINNITMPAGKTNYRIIFGGAYSQNNGGTYDNIFKPESFHVAVGNGTDWSGNLTYEKIGGSDTTDPYWVQFAVDFTLKEAVSQLSIRFTADLASVFAIDDVQLVEGNGGQEVDLEGGVVPPDPGEATAITIPELIAQMTDTEAPVDANADRYLDAVVMNDVAGANYTFNNLILATENATEAGNGITLYGSQVEPSTLGLNKGDKVRVTLYKGLAKVVNYSGMYEVTGDKNATWCKVEKTGTVTSIPTATIAAADLAKYQGMAVTIANASVAQAGVWASASALSSHTFTADGANFTVFCKQSDEKNPSVFLDVPFKAGSGNISGLAAVYKNNSQLVPRNLDDVAAFSDSSTPMITGVTPASVSIPAIGGNETIIVSVANKGENVLSVSGLSGLLEATVDNANNMVTVTAQPNTGAVQNQTLTIAIAGGNSVTVPVTLLGVGGGGTGEVVAFSITDIKADNADLPTNGYGSQVVATPSTWVSWTVGGIEFTGVKICEAPASNGSIIQMQGNASDATKQAKLRNVTPIDGMSKIKIVFRSYGTTKYAPGYTMTVAGAARTPVETYTDESGYREYVHEYDLTGLGADSFELDNNKVRALYIESFEITK